VQTTNVKDEKKKILALSSFVGKGFAYKRLPEMVKAFISNLTPF
jgi:hypothetical protein